MQTLSVYLQRMNKKKNKVLVAVSNDLYTDQRVHKICSFIHKQGYDVKLIGRLKKDSPSSLNRAYQTFRFRMIFHKGALFYAEFNLKLFFYLLFNPAQKIVSNDLDTLLACYLAKKLKPRCKLVYDSHEYFTEVPELVSRPKIQKIWELIEGTIFPNLNHISTVNQSIANLYKKKYNKNLAVIRNIAPKWHKPESLKSKSELGIPEGKLILIIQGAGINIDRGAEEAVEAMKKIENACLIIVGDGDVVPSLKNYVKEERLTEKVLFFPKVDYQTLMQYTFHADIGLTLDKPLNINYQYSLPNKVFDYIQAGTPILGSNLIEVATIIQQFEVGITINEVNAKTIINSIEKIQKEPKLLDLWKSNCNKVQDDLCWEKECLKLEKFYPKLTAFHTVS